jgi:hypothetical protein
MTGEPGLRLTRRPEAVSNSARLAAPTVAARAAEEHVVSSDHVAMASCDAGERRLQRRVLEGLDLAAVVAHQVVVVHSVGVRRLEAGDAVAEIDALNEPELREALERPIDARDTDTRAARAKAVVDLLRGNATGLATEEVDDRPPGAAGSPARLAQATERALCPGARH